MSKNIDFTKPLSDEDKLWLHQWGYDYKIIDNEQRFRKVDEAEAGEPINLALTLEEAGLEVPEPQPNPLLPADVAATGFQVGVENESETAVFDEEATRAEVAELTVAELNEEIKALGAKPEGNKAALVNQLVELLRDTE